jgi:hypothetical protein
MIGRVGVSPVDRRGREERCIPFGAARTRVDDEMGAAQRVDEDWCGCRDGTLPSARPTRKSYDWTVHFARRCLMFALAAAGSSAASGDALAVEIAPVVIEVIGSEEIHAFVAAGTTTPCESDANKPLFRGVVKPNAPVTLASDAICVCWKQTFAPFKSVGWSSPRIQCRPPAKDPKNAPSLEKPLHIVARSRP